MTTFAEARKRPVVDASTATRVARVAGFVIDIASGAVQGVRLAGWSGHGEVVAWEHVQGFGADAVMLRAADAVEPLAEGAVTDDAILGKLVLSERGEALGKATDVAFDAGSGAIEHLVVERGAAAPGRILGVGGYAVVVSAAADGEPPSTQSSGGASRL